MQPPSFSHRFRCFFLFALACLSFASPPSIQAQSLEEPTLSLRMETSVLLSAPLKLASLLESPLASLTQRFKPASPPVSVLLNPSPESADLVATAASGVVLQRVQAQQTLLKQHLQDTYSVDDAMAHEVVKTAFQAGQKYNIDPLLLLAVMKVESTFNPRAVSSANAKGLMQVLPSAHPEKIAAVGGVHQLFVPHVNIKMGAQILRDCLNRAGGAMTQALQFYNGSGSDPKQRYAKKVMVARQELVKTQLVAFTDVR